MIRRAQSNVLSSSNRGQHSLLFQYNKLEEIKYYWIWSNEKQNQYTKDNVSSQKYKKN